MGESVALPQCGAAAVASRRRGSRPHAYPRRCPGRTPTRRFYETVALEAWFAVGLRGGWSFDPGDSRHRGGGCEPGGPEWVGREQRLWRERWAKRNHQDPRQAPPNRVWASRGGCRERAVVRRRGDGCAAVLLIGQARLAGDCL